MNELKSHMTAVTIMEQYQISQVGLDYLRKLHQISQNCSNDVRETKRLGQLTLTDTTVIRQRDDFRQLQEIAQWMSDIDPQKRQDDVVKTHQPGTCQLFLEGEAFQQWKEGTVSKLLCTVGPGVGKTTMAAAVIPNFQKDPGCTSPIVLLFCNYKSQSLQDTTKILEVLLRQFICSRCGVPGPIQTLYEDFKQKGRRPSEAEISEAFVLYSINV